MIVRRAKRRRRCWPTRRNERVSEEPQALKRSDRNGVQRAGSTFIHMGVIRMGVIRMRCSLDAERAEHRRPLGWAPRGGKMRLCVAVCPLLLEPVSFFR